MVILMLLNLNPDIHNLDFYPDPDPGPLKVLDPMEHGARIRSLKAVLCYAFDFKKLRVD